MLEDTEPLGTTVRNGSPSTNILLNPKSIVAIADEAAVVAQDLC